MYVNISVMRPAGGHEHDLLDSMHRFNAAARAAGSVLCITARDEESGALLGVAVWESAEAQRDAGAALMQAVSGDDFETWVSKETHHRGPEV